ncbi:hypothetical protein llap_7199 [Limosa lapponica baueri]|uniref:Uncharacterized protein n=1 Tax=Limosa lapponica baueri TaxID=1758121 RepID=A0A2I0U8W6_LIMLA|nr:hypothetical protein llap_7199 [Limosa lapponica baueri]
MNSYAKREDNVIITYLFLERIKENQDANCIPLKPDICADILVVCLVSCEKAMFESRQSNEVPGLLYGRAKLLPFWAKTRWGNPESVFTGLALASILPTAICRVSGSRDSADCPAGFWLSLLECHQGRDHMGIPMAEIQTAKEPERNKIPQEVIPAGNITREKTPTNI